ncbi:MAG: hypothetical protein HYS12_14815 [Planctomycetes bacterium]|nr:hypothetical protein [Planctomycetota bacterium]
MPCWHKLRAGQEQGVWFHLHQVLLARLPALADWLPQRGVTHVALESAEALTVRLLLNLPTEAPSVHHVAVDLERPRQRTLLDQPAEHLVEVEWTPFR